MHENCKDCPYVDALDKRVGIIEFKVITMEEKINTATTENEKTKIYYEKIIEKIDNLQESFSLKMFSFENRLEKVEKALEDKKSGMWTKFSESPWSTKVLVYLLSTLAGLRLMGIDISKLLQ